MIADEMLNENGISTENKDIELAKHLSKHTNEFLSKYEFFDLNNLRIYLHKSKCCYYTGVASFLKKNNKIKYSRKGGNGIDFRYSDLYTKIDAEPIHYKVFLELIFQYRKSVSNYKKNRELPVETANSELQDKSDKQLADELRRRGYTVSATKTIEL